MYQIWDFFYREDSYSFWKEKVKNYQNFNLFTWEKILGFLSALEQTPSLKNHLLKTNNLAQFIQVAAENNYFFTEEEIVWVMITKQQIWDFFAIAQKTPTLREELLSTKTPQQFLEIAKQHDYYFSIEALGWILTEIKLSSKVRIFNPTGQVFFTPVIAGICTGSWIGLAESWGLVPPFCHINKPTGLVRWDEDINDEKYSLRQCFLPPGYFNQRLIM
jgi:hypothetical protein